MVYLLFVSSNVSEDGEDEERQTQSYSEMIDQRFSDEL